MTAVNCLPVCRAPLPTKMEVLFRLGVVSGFPAHLAITSVLRTKAGMMWAPLNILGMTNNRLHTLRENVAIL